jgi:prepilin-type N-terminal cleavage/methylation domain-containing protein
MIGRAYIRCLHDDGGFTLIELLVSMLIGLIVTGAAFAILEFTTSDVKLTTERAHLDQAGRIALENIMLELHSACVQVEVHPIEPGSNENEILFLSERSPLNTLYKEPTSTLPEVRERKIVFNKAAGTLIEKSWPTLLTNKYVATEPTSPTTELLLKGVKPTVEEGKAVPIFRYYRYYQSTDQLPSGDTTMPYGELNPEPIPSSKLTTTAQTMVVAKVAVSFTLAPEGNESVFAKGYRPIAFEDSAILRLAPASESERNFSCTERT